MSEADEAPTITWGPKAPDHPSVGAPCPVCGRPFVAGDLTAPLFLGPASHEEAEKMELGRAYNAEVLEVHCACLEGFTCCRRKVTDGFGAVTVRNQW